MTTIAYDGRTLAADTQSQTSVLLKMHKLHRLPDGSIFAGSGSAQEVLAVLAWLRGGDKPGHLNDFEGLIVTPQGTERLGERLMRVPSLEPFYAIGSGAHFALAAMACGKSAVQAVRISARFDPYTGGRVESMRIAAKILA
ncbi:MAG: hypothetical protein ACREVW_08805 [Burkholderiales bacterium]